MIVCLIELFFIISLFNIDLEVRMKKENELWIEREKIAQETWCLRKNQEENSRKAKELKEVRHLFKPYFVFVLYFQSYHSN